MLSLSWRSMMSLIRSAKPPRLESCHRFFAPDRYPCDGRNVLRSSAWIAKQRADRLQRTEYKFWAVQQATLSPPKSFRDSQRTPAALNRAVARACRPRDNKLHTTSYRRRIAPCAPVSAIAAILLGTKRMAVSPVQTTCGQRHRAMQSRTE